MSLAQYFPAVALTTPVPTPTTAVPIPTQVSQLHYLVPATSENDLFCAVIAAALVNRYPVPFLIGWRGEGEFDAKEAHVAKLRTIQRYLNTLPHGGEDDDLVVVGDGHDVMAQLPVEVVIERYFQLASEADRRLADRFGLSVEEAHERGLRQTLIWGADKMCWPGLYDEAQCSAIPPSHLAPNKFGPRTNGGDKTYDDAKFLNSGSVIGPLGDLRKFMDAAVAEMEETYDLQFKYRDSDQIYIARLFGQQEVTRAEQITNEALHAANGANPLPKPEEGDQGVSDYHVALDYESALFQTGCYSHKWMHKLNYNHSDNTATMDGDKFDQGRNFKPYPVQMPANVYKALLRIFQSVPELKSLMSAREWIGSLALDTNMVSRHIFAFYHATCSKKHLLKDFTEYWFHPLMEPLLKAAFHATQGGQPITEKLIDGRRWVYKTSYPELGVFEEQLGGVFTDFEGTEFIPYTTLCAEYLDILQH